MIPIAVGLVILHVALASDTAQKADDGYHAGRHGHHDRGYGGGTYYRGRYAGKCGYDGFYYRDSHSFVICSNGNAYVQPCAPGTRNSGHKSYQYGKAYSAVPFCDVNLVDYGYNLKHGYGHGHKGGYGHGSYGHGGRGGYGHGRRGGYGGGYGHGRRHGHGGGGYGYGNDYGYGGYDNDYHRGGRHGGYGHRRRGYGRDYY